MHLAALEDDLEMVKYLVRSGGDADIVSGNGCYTPLLHASIFGASATVYDYLIEQGADLDHVCPHDGQGILYSIRTRRADVPAEAPIMMTKPAGGRYTDFEWQAIGDKMLDSIAKHCRRGLKFNICDELEKS